MGFQIGDRVLVEAKSTERPARIGTVREVLGKNPTTRYRIGWDDGHESIYTPEAGSLQPAPSVAPGS
jgi:hypothetical protein